MSLSSSTSHPTSTSTDKYDTLHFSIQKYVLNNFLCLLSTTMFSMVLYIQHYHILHSFRRSGPGVIVIHVMQAPFTNPLSSTPHYVHYGSDFLFISKHSSAASVPAFSVFYFEDYNRLILSTSTYTERITSHSPSHFLLPCRGCSPYIAAHFPWTHTLGIVMSTIPGAHFLLPVHPTVCTFTAHLRLPQSITVGPPYRRLDDTRLRPSHCCLSIGHCRIPSAIDVLPPGIVASTIPMSGSRNREQI